MISILKILLGNKNISFVKSVCLILILISAPLLFSQRIFLDNSIENKNQLFELLGVKKQIIQYKQIQLNDTSINDESTQILFIDTLGFVNKKEKQYSRPDNGYSSKSLFIYERDCNGNIVRILEDGELKETRVYNEMNRIKRFDYKAYELRYSGTYEYDSSGNEIQYSYIMREDTILTRKSKYDTTHALLLEKSLIDFGASRERTCFQYDSSGRITKEFTVYTDKNLDDSTLYFYNDALMKDSTVEYYDSHILKTVKEYDKKSRPYKLTFYNEADSLLEFDILEYDDMGIEIKDSIFTANDLELPQKPYDEMMDEQIEAKMIVNGKVSFTTTTSYYPNGLLKQMIKTDYDQNRIEETYYEYEFY